MRCVTPVDLNGFPADTHTRVLVGSGHGYENCQVLFTRFAKAGRPRQTVDDGLDRLIFVVQASSRCNRAQSKSSLKSGH